MQAAVYHGRNDIRIETVPVPEILPGEILVRVHACGICGTDLKKISTGSHSAPRVFGHETAGVVVKVGPAVAGFQTGDRVMVFHHIPCGNCFYCQRKVFAQCPVYKKVGATAGFEPSGGGFAEYVRVMDWIAQRGVVRIPDHVSFEQAAFVEPINTCMKGIEGLHLERGETVLVIGSGPIGIILGVLAQRAGTRVISSDLYPERLQVAKSFGISEFINASTDDTVTRACALTEGRGADVVIVAVPGNSLVQTALNAARPGGRIMLFAHTARSEAEIDPAAICVDEKSLLGSYSASVDLQEESVRLVFSGEIDFSRLISHRFPLPAAVEAIQLAANPRPDSMKVMIAPTNGWHGGAQ
jgi:L-iditol 2-dehydrogenase